MPAQVQNLADQAYARLKQDPRHPSLHFKRVGRFWFSPRQLTANQRWAPEELPMAWFRRESRRTVDDPVFGALTLRRRSDWEGEVASPTPGETLAISISRPSEPPTAADREVFTEFIANYSRLVPAVSSELFKLLDPSVRTPGWDGPSPRTADELWRMLRLESLHLQPGRPLELLFAFRGDVWPDAMFTVAVAGTDVRGLSLDD